MNSENLLYKVIPKPFDKIIILPTSKSHANRALIIGAIRGNGFKVNQLPESSDVTTLLSCLETVGLKLTKSGDSVIFHNSFPACEAENPVKIIDLKTGDGGTTNRFLLALLSRGKKTYRFFPAEKMSQRPMDDLILPLKSLNVEIDFNREGAWLTLKGPAVMYNTTKLDIDCKKSTQFSSAMMLAFSPIPLTFNLLNIEASETYILMTRAILSETLLKNTYTVPVDFSSLSYPLALAVTSGRVLFSNVLKVDLLQADSRLIEILQKAGADIEWTDKGLLATAKNPLDPFDVDGSQFPDLVPTLVFLASKISGTSRISHLSVLRHKESDRLEEIMKLLNVFEVPFQYNDQDKNEELLITGRDLFPEEIDLYPPRDHRMVMTSFLFLAANSGGGLAEMDCVQKSFPNFFKVMS